MQLSLTSQLVETRFGLVPISVHCQIPALSLLCTNRLYRLPLHPLLAGAIVAIWLLSLPWSLRIARETFVNKATAGLPIDRLAALKSLNATPDGAIEIYNDARNQGYLDELGEVSFVLAAHLAEQPEEAPFAELVDRTYLNYESLANVVVATLTGEPADTRESLIIPATCHTDGN